MSINDSLYPNYPGNTQRLDPNYSEGDDTIAGAGDYNKHDDEILKHQYLIKNLNMTSGAGGVSSHALLTNLDYATSGHSGFQSSLSTGAGISIVGSIISGTQDQNVFDIISIEGTNITANNLKTTLNLKTGAGISFSADNITKTLTIYGTVAPDLSAYFKLDQLTPQNVINGAPQFDEGITIKANKWIYLDGT